MRIKYDNYRCPKCSMTFIGPPTKFLCRQCKNVDGKTVVVEKFVPKETLKLVKYDPSKGMAGVFLPIEFTEGTPLRIWTTMYSPASTPTLPLPDSDRLIAEDKIHDWNFDSNSKTIRYYSRFPNTDSWILIEYM